MKHVKLVVRWGIVLPLEMVGLSVLFLAIRLIDWTDA